MRHLYNLGLYLLIVLFYLRNCQWWLLNFYCQFFTSHFLQYSSPLQRPQSHFIYWNKYVGMYVARKENYSEIHGPIVMRYIVCSNFFINNFIYCAHYQIVLWSNRKITISTHFNQLKCTYRNHKLSYLLLYVILYLLNCSRKKNE